MKLVDILAQELKAWPKGVEEIEQSDVSLTLFKAGGFALDQKAYSVSERAEDRFTAKVSRAQWQAAVDALKAGDSTSKVPEGYELRDEALRSLRYVAETGQLILKENEQSRFIGLEAGSVNHHGYRRMHVLNTRIDAHRLVWLMHYGALPEGEVDHINGNKLDNRLENLRLADQQRNQQNVGVRSDSRLGIKGVRIRPSGKYQARVKLTDGSRLVKSFVCLDAAVAWLSSARKDSHGEFARDTSEQIAAEERENEIKEMMSIVKANQDYSARSASREEYVEHAVIHLHRMGYRKQEQP